MGKFITRRRVDRRIASVLGKISGLSKDEVREMVELEYQQAANAGVVDKEKAEKEAEAEVEAEAEAEVEAEAAALVAGVSPSGASPRWVSS